MKEIKEHFIGNIDQFIEHCSNIDVDQLYIDLEEKDCLHKIQLELGCDVDTALELYNKLILQEISETLNQLIDRGLVEIVGYDVNGIASYSLTPLGKQIQLVLKNKR